METTTAKGIEMTEQERRTQMTIEYKRRVNAAWSAANPKRRSPHVPFPEVVANRTDIRW